MNVSKLANRRESVVVWLGGAAFGAIIGLIVFASLASVLWKFSDLYPRWYGSREMIFERISPYSEQVTREIQLETEGKSLAGMPVDQRGFAYPPVIAVLILPLLFTDFTTAHLLWTVFLGIIAALCILLYLRWLRWHLSPLELGFVLAGALLFEPFWSLFALGSFSLIPAFFIALAAIAADRNKYVTAGALAGVVLVKPQLGFLVLFGLVIWAITAHNGLRFLVGLGGGVAALFAASQLLWWSWLPEFLGYLPVYVSANQAASPISHLVTWALAGQTAWIGPVSLILEVSLVTLAIVVWIRLAHLRLPLSDAALPVALSQAVQILVVPSVRDYNLASLVLPLCYIAYRTTRLANPRIKALAALSYFLAYIVIPWVSFVWAYVNGLMGATQDVGWQINQAWVAGTAAVILALAAFSGRWHSLAGEAGRKKVYEVYRVLGKAG